MEIKREEEGDNGRFFIEQDNRVVAEMTYTWRTANRIIIHHTEVNPSLKGQGVGNLLVAEAVRFAREQGIKIIPLCSFAKHVFDKTPEYAGVL